MPVRITYRRKECKMHRPKGEASDQNKDADAMRNYLYKMRKEQCNEI
jgi:hypothetical protein